MDEMRWVGIRDRGLLVRGALPLAQPDVQLPHLLKVDNCREWRVAMLVHQHVLHIHISIACRQNAILRYSSLVQLQTGWSGSLTPKHWHSRPPANWHHTALLRDAWALLVFLCKVNPQVFNLWVFELGRKVSRNVLSVVKFEFNLTRGSWRLHGGSVGCQT
jgi:hypothetical protein